MTPRTVRREITDADYQPASYLAELFHKSAQTIYGWGKRGEIRKIVKGGTTMFSVADCRAKVAHDNIANGIIAPKASIEDGKYLTLEAKGMRLKEATPIVSELLAEALDEKRVKIEAKEADHNHKKGLVEMSQAKLKEAASQARTESPAPIKITAGMAPTDALGEVDRKIAERKQSLLDQIALHEAEIAAIREQISVIEEKEVMALEAREAFNKLASLLSEF